MTSARGVGEFPVIVVAMFVFYSNRSGCLGSLAISIVASVVLLLLMRSC